MRVATSLRGLVLASGLAFLSACTATSPYMHETRAPAPSPAPDGATVVFIRPSSWANTQKFTVLDAQAHFLGDSLPSSYFAIKVPAGEHLFIAWGENTAPLRALLEAGRVYFVEVAPKMGAFSPRVHLLAVSPRTATWPKLREWLTSSSHLETDPAGQRYLDDRRDDVVERIRRAKDALTKLSQDELAERTLVPEDGIK